MGAKHAPRRTLFTVTVVTVVALGAIGTAVALDSVGGTHPTASRIPRTLDTPAPDATLKPAAASAPVSTATTVPVADVRPAVAAFVEQIDSMAPDTDPEAISKVVTGAALDELKAQQMEFAANGWTVSGRTKVDGLTVLASDPAGTPPTATVQACLDAGDLTVLRSDGSAMPRNPEASTRALNIYGLNYVDGAWVVVSHTFPQDPTC